jgi:hypothetical protein
MEKKNQKKAEKEPFRVRFWWLPAAIMGSSIVLSLLTLLIAAMKE